MLRIQKERHVLLTATLSICAFTAAAAAKINAQLQARKGIQHVDVPPIRSDSTKSAEGGAPAGTINGEMYIADGDYIKDIEVNDLRNRYTLTKGSTQKMVNTLPGHIPADHHKTALIHHIFISPFFHCTARLKAYMKAG